MFVPRLPGHNKLKVNKKTHHVTQASDQPNQVKLPGLLPDFLVQTMLEPAAEVIEAYCLLLSSTRQQTIEKDRNVCHGNKGAIARIEIGSAVHWLRPWY